MTFLLPLRTQYSFQLLTTVAQSAQISPRPPSSSFSLLVLSSPFDYYRDWNINTESGSCFYELGTRELIIHFKALLIIYLVFNSQAKKDSLAVLTSPQPPTEF
jgi:hypothetical protein